MLEVKDIKLTLDDGTPTAELSPIAEYGQMLCFYYPCKCKTETQKMIEKRGQGNI